MAGLTLVLTDRELEAAVNGQRIGYVRVSTVDQNESRQLEGQVLDRVSQIRPQAGTPPGPS